MKVCAHPTRKERRTVRVSDRLTVYVYVRQEFTVLGVNQKDIRPFLVFEQP